MNIAHERIKNDDRIENQDEFNMMFIFIQDHYLNLDGSGMTVGDTSGILKKSDATVRKKLRIMEDKGLIKKVKSNPLVYILPNEYLES